MLGAPYREIAADLNGAVSHNTVHNWMWKDFRETAVRMGGGEPGAGGGLPEADGWSPLSRKAEEALEALDRAREAFNGVTDPPRRDGRCTRGHGGWRGRWSGPATWPRRSWMIPRSDRLSKMDTYCQRPAP